MMEDIKKECQVYEKAFIVIADFIIALLIIRIFWVYKETQVAGLDLVDRIAESFVYVFALVLAVTVNVLLHKRISDEIWKLDIEYLCDKNKALFPSIKVIEEDMEKAVRSRNNLWVGNKVTIYRVFDKAWAIKNSDIEWVCYGYRVNGKYRRDVRFLEITLKGGMVIPIKINEEFANKIVRKYKEMPWIVTDPEKRIKHLYKGERAAFEERQREQIYKRKKWDELQQQISLTRQEYNKIGYKYTGKELDYFAAPDDSPEVAVESEAGNRQLKAIEDKSGAGAASEEVVEEAVDYGENPYGADPEKETGYSRYGYLNLDNGKFGVEAEEDASVEDEMTFAEGEKTSDAGAASEENASEVVKEAFAEKKEALEAGKAAFRAGEMAFEEDEENFLYGTDFEKARLEAKKAKEEAEKARLEAEKARIEAEEAAFDAKYAGQKYSDDDNSEDDSSEGESIEESYMRKINHYNHSEEGNAKISDVIV
ncbi:MAG: hypothetical protein K6F97_09645 [Lachnospiraceae bacterium]|nr:hypothetical protein [Lachnospiraceae bacterium]